MVDDGVANVEQCDAVQVVAAARLKTSEVNHRKAVRQDRDRDQGLVRGCVGGCGCERSYGEARLGCQRF